MNMTRAVNISQIRIKGSFKNSVPNDYKLAQCREYWSKHGFYLHDIIVNDKGYLVDGYIQYLVLKENNIKDVVVKGFDKKIHKRNKSKVRKGNVWLPIYPAPPVTKIAIVFPPFLFQECSVLGRTDNRRNEFSDAA